MWKVHGEREVYANPWLAVHLADVELPDGRHLDHYLLRQRAVALTAIVDSSERVLLLWRHRFIPDTWGYELPAGVTDPGESPLAAAAREAEEETGWRPRGLRPLLELTPGAGLTDCVHHVFWTDEAEHLGAPLDAHEAERVDWIPLADVPELISSGQVRESSTVAALLQLFVHRRAH